MAAAGHTSHQGSVLMMQAVLPMAEEAGLARASQEKLAPRFEVGEEVLGVLHVFEKSGQSNDKLARL